MTRRLNTTSRPQPRHLTAHLVQNLMLPPLWAVARAFGVRPYYTRWDSRIPEGDRPPPPMSEHGPDQTGRS